MRNSISKLIVAGMTLALSLTSVNAQTLSKLPAPKSGNSNALVNSKVTANSSKLRVKGLTTKSPKQMGTQLSQTSSFSRHNNSSVQPRLNAPMNVAASDVELYGSLIYSDFFDLDDPAYGIYSIPTDGATEINDAVTINPLLSVNGSAYYADGIYYATVMDSFLGYILGIYHYAVDTETWEIIEEVPDDMSDLSTVGFDAAYDETTGRVYGCYYAPDGGGYVFGSQEVGTFKTNIISYLNEIYNAVGVDAHGNVYAITENGYLYSVDKNTGEESLIGYTGVTPGYLTSGTIDQKSNVMYWTVSTDDGGYLYTVDLATAEATLVSEFAGMPELTGLFIPGAPAEDGAPDAVTNLNVIPGSDGGQEASTDRTAYITFTLPSKAYDGTPIWGQLLDYTILRNGTEIYSNNGAAGTGVEYLDVVPASGQYTYTVYASNNAGKGVKNKVTLWVGPGVPCVPQNVNLEYTNGAFNLTWDAVDASALGGDLSSNVTYNVRLYCNGQQIYNADGLTEPYYSVDVVEPEALSVYYCSVEAVTTAARSDLGTSNYVTLGNALTPYLEEFESNKGYTIIDANEDGTTWSIGEGVAAVSWNSELPMDDYLVTPGILLKGGNQYTFSFAAKAGSSSYPEYVEVLMGDEPTIEGLTNVLFDPFKLPYEDYGVYSSVLTPEADGVYYFAIHGCSDADMLRILVDYISVSEGVSVNNPAAPENLIVNSNPEGELNAEISFNVPTKTIAGEETKVIKTELYRDDELINTVLFPAVDEPVVYTDVVPADGLYTYKAIAYNTNGTPGAAAVKNAFVGINRPGEVTNAKVVETSTPGEVTVTWDAPTTDIDGNNISLSYVAYNVYDKYGQLVAENITETTCTYQAVPEGEQEFVYYCVYAVTKAGESANPGISNMIAAGTPFTLPIEEPFTDASLSCIWGTEAVNGDAYWMLFSDDSLGIPDYDGNNGYAAMRGSNLYDAASLISGKITLDVEVPVLTFAYFSIDQNDINTVSVSVKTAEMSEPVEVFSAVCDGGYYQWIPARVNLSEYAGQTIQVYFTSEVLNYAYSMIDAIKIAQPADKELAAVSINAPAMVDPNTEYNVVVSVVNQGAKEAAGYSVELYDNGTLAEVVAGEPLAVNATANVEIPQTLSVVSAESHVYYAKVIFEDDADESNNTTYEVATHLKVFPAPVAQNLEATSEGAGITLTWQEPDLVNNMPTMPITDDFESYTAFATSNVGDWTLVDADMQAVGGVSGVTFGDIVNGESLVSFFVVNTEDAGVAESESFVANSGVQYMASLYAYSGSAVSDWMISPELSGWAQTISFYAKSLSSAYPESFNIYYSETDADVESFILLASYRDISDAWTEYSADLPNGAKYFAIESCATDAFMFMVDDVTYAPANGEAVELTIAGYNIYRNGVKINDAPVADTTYVDAEGSADDVYVVTVVYTDGESGPSNEAQAKSSAINAANSAVANVSVVAHNIIVAGAEGMVNVYTVDGKMLYSAAAQPTNTIAVAPGVYMVKAGKLVKKVIVK